MKHRSAVANYEYNRNTIVGIPVETLHATSLLTPSQMRYGNPSGWPRAVEDMRPFQPASRSGCNPNGMQRPVVEYLFTERRIPTGCRPTSANDTRIVNPVETPNLGVFTTKTTAGIPVETLHATSLQTRTPLPRIPRGCRFDNRVAYSIFIYKL
jgi:hypothetical protein